MTSGFTSYYLAEMKKNDDKQFAEIMAQFYQAGNASIQNLTSSMPYFTHFSKDFVETCTRYAQTLTNNPQELFKLQMIFMNFIQKQMLLWNEFSAKLKNGTPSPVPPQPSQRNGDKRFTAPEWNEYPFFFDFLKRSYLLISELTMNIVESVDTDEMTKKKIVFYTRQYLDALSPSNFIFTNPEILKLVSETDGKNLKEGYKNFLADSIKGRISQTDESAFEVGRNLAITPGDILFENELVQLIRYKPVTKNIYEIPLLIVPPWINKYYILDLEPGNSFVKYYVEQGLSVFMISWKNPTAKNENFTWDDYVIKGLFAAINAVTSLSGSKKVNLLGYCIGGTLLGIGCAILPRLKKHNQSFPLPGAVNTATFLASMHDFSDIGPMSAIIDEDLVSLLEKRIEKESLMSGHALEDAFNMIRANDLIWSYVVNNYLKGNKPAPFSILYWSNDNTNLPGKMYAYYLRNMVLENKLILPDTLSLAGVPVDLGRINIPVCIVGTREDHISPCKTAFRTTALVKGPVEFILGNSGHVMGIVNPPAKNKYGYLINGKLGYGFDEWLKTAKSCDGSWWSYWKEWLKKYSGKNIPATQKPSGKLFKVIEPAPGRYVKGKIH